MPWDAHWIPAQQIAGMTKPFYLDGATKHENDLFLKFLFTRRAVMNLMEQQNITLFHRKTVEKKEKRHHP